MPRIKGWLFGKPNGSFTAPVKNSNFILIGFVYGDRRYDPLTGAFRDGTWINVSQVERVDLLNNKAYTKSGIVYDLVGFPDKRWVSWMKKQKLWEEYIPGN